MSYVAKTAEPPKKYRPNWLEELDGRLNIAKAMRERFDVFAEDLGGRESLSYAQLSLIERALWLEYWLGRTEHQLAKGEEIAVGNWVQASNALQGIYRALGLERRAKPVPSLHDYMAARAAERTGGGGSN